jgi:phosphoribosylaminoimidazolecarboxamide formyltransferase/IMP cyclohydrolase
VEPADYPELIEQLPQPDREFRKKMAARAFRHTALYDATIAGWFFKETKEVGLLEKMALPLAQVQPLRYGENPHQKAAFYRVAGEEGRSLANAQQLQGKELSYNNLADADAAVRCVFELKGPGAVIIKHANPCGAGLHPEGLTKAFTLALSGDPVSAYGGILAFNRKLETDAAMAVLESKVFFEVIAAPGISEEAAALFASKKNLRLISLPEDWQSQKAEGFDGKRVSGGWLLQSWDEPQSIPWKAVLKEATPEELETLQFAWTLCRNVKSNAIVLAKAEGGGFVLNGVGAGQMSRVDSVRLAISKATRPIPGSCLASDAFFPFADGVVVALEAGVRAFVQPGGSIRDAEVLEAARAKDATMYFTDTRHFRH